MKKVILTFGVAAMIIGMTACGGSDKNTKTTSSDFETETVESSDQPGETGSASLSGSESSESDESVSEGSSSGAGFDAEDAMRKGKDLTKDAIDEGQRMLNEELDKHGVAGKAAKALYGKAADDMRSELNKSDVGGGDDDNDDDDD